MRSNSSPSHPLRVLHLINSLGPGGAERSISELAPALRSRGVELGVVCLRRKREGVEHDLRSTGCAVRYLSRTGWVARATELRRIIQTGGFDLVHTTLFQADVLGRLAAVGTGKPVLTSLVNTSYDPVRLDDPNVGRWRLEIARMLDGWTARNLTLHFHAITGAVRDSSVRALGITPDRVTVVPRGRDPVRLGTPGTERRTAVRHALGIPHDTEVVVNVGRQEYQKGQRYLLEAAALLSAHRHDLLVLVAGREGHASRELSQLVENLGLEDRVRLLGMRNDVPDLLAAADLFVFPSLYEGMGGAVVEAMALGLPIVASDVPALREVVEDGTNGLLVPKGDSEALADAISQLLDRREISASFGEESRAIFERRFTLEHQVERMADLYRRVAHAEEPMSRTHAPAAAT